MRARKIKQGKRIEEIRKEDAKAKVRTASSENVVFEQRPAGVMAEHGWRPCQHESIEVGAQARASSPAARRVWVRSMVVLTLAVHTNRLWSF